MTGWVSPTMGPEEHEQLLAIETGIPGYMKPHVINWLMARSMTNIGYFDESVPSILSLAFKTLFPTRSDRYEQFIAALTDDTLVSLLDWFLFHGVNGAQFHAQDLKVTLDLGRSEWTVTDIDENKPRVTRRIPSGVEIAYKDVIGKTGASGQLLVEAFNAVYGPHANSDSAYGLSVKAVETLACPKYLPSSTRATLGSVISHLSQKNVSLPLLEGNAPDKELIVSMMRKLWAGGERHGSETYRHVSADGAKAALALAFSLVSMLHEDVISVS